MGITLSGSLTRLNIRREPWQREKQDATLSSTVLLAAIRPLALLEHLTLKLVLPSLPISTTLARLPSVGPLVKLACLQSLTITGCALASVSFMD